MLVMLIVTARVGAQSIPVPPETPRAGSSANDSLNPKNSNPTWRPKGYVLPAQAQQPADIEPTLAPPLHEQAASDMQTLRAPANAQETSSEFADESEREAEPQPIVVRQNPARANPLRPARPPQTARRQPPQRIENPVDLEYDAEPVPRPVPPRMLQEVPGPNGRPVPRKDWQVGPQRIVEPNSISERPYEEWPADINNPTAAAQDQYPDGQVPGEELYGMPRVFETNAYGRFSGRGEPLTAGSWMNRPYYVGGFIGGIGGDTLVDGEINQNGGFYWGGNLGWDYDHYWGLEMRLAFSSQGLDYLQYPTIDNSYNELVLWDTSFLYYPWGDSRWRPYFKLGFGFADFDYTDATGIRRSEMVYEMPFGIGLKYRVNQYWTWRFDATDNLIFGGNVGMETQNQFSLAAGLEYRFGGRRQSYWPWNPSRRWR